MMWKSILSKLSPHRKSRLRGLYYDQKKKLVDAFFSYGPEQLEQSLTALGVRRGDTLLLHSSFNPLCGFTGSPQDLMAVFFDAVGPQGNLMMVSLPYASSSFEYLKTLTCFDVNKTPSRMGMISELFRKQQGVVRSLHPTHPILACGPKAEWIVANHENCLYPCGPGTPFEKLVLLDGKVVFFYVSFVYFTFFHYLEDMVRDKLPFSLYTKEPFAVPVVDSAGRPGVVRTHVFAPEAIKRRRFHVLEKEFWRRGVIRKLRVGNTRLLLVEARQAVSCTKEMIQHGRFFYRMS